MSGSSGLAMMILAGLLSGCAGLSADQMSSSAAGGPESDAASNAAGLTIRGKAINSYLENALVFSDANADGRYSPGESFAITDALGNYLLSNPALAPLVVKSLSNLSDAERSAIESTIPTDQLDQFRALRTTQLASDNTKKAWDGMMTTSVAVLKDGESINITPYSTLHQALSKTMSPEDAQKLLLEVYGVAPNQDYIADVSQQLLDPSIQSNAVAVSNLIKIAIQNWGDLVSPDQIFTTLASQLLDVTHQLDELGVPLAKASDLFARVDQIKDIYITLLKQLDIEIQIADLNEIILSAAELNKDFIDQSSLRLVSDTGESSFDFVTSDWRVNRIDLNPQTTEYLLKERDALTGDYEIDAEDDWVKDLSELQDGLAYKPASDGFYRLYVRDTLHNENSPEFITFYFDSHAPTFSLANQNLLFEDTGVSGISSTFTDKITSNIKLNQNSLDQLVVQDAGSDVKLFYLVTKNTGSLIPSADSLWMDFVNFPKDSSANNGDQISLWLKAVDQAGNASVAQSFQFQFDPNAPDAMPSSEVLLVRDTGFISKDWVSQSLEINSLSSWAQRNLVTLEYRVTDMLADHDSNGLWARQYVAPTSDGSYRIEVRQLDLAGNISDILGIDAVRDTVAPEAILPGELILAHDTGGIDMYTADPTVIGLRLPDSWFEYRVTQNSESETTVVQDWSRRLQLTQDGTYQIAVRRTDLAGNYEDLNQSLVVHYDGVRPVISLDEGFSIADDQAWADVYRAFEMAINDRDNSVDISAIDLIDSVDIQLKEFSAISRDSVGHFSNLIQLSHFSDETQRQAMLIANSDHTAIYAGDDQSALWDGISVNNLPTDYRVVGRLGNDYFKNIDSGDIFIGGRGYDIAQFASNATILGVGFTSFTEQSALLNLVDGVIPNFDGNQLDIGTTPLLKLFSQSPFDSTEEGLSFVQAELIRYSDTEGHSQYMYLDQKAGEQFWSLNLSNSTNYLFFDGSGLAVRGGNLADELVGGSGSDLFYGRSSGSGVDKLSGGAGDDIFVAGSYEYQTDDHSRVIGGGGSDRIVMVAGEIQATGNDGADRYYLAPSFYEGNVALKVAIQDFEVGSDQLCIPTSFKQDLMNYLTILEGGTGMSIDLHGLSLNVEGMNLAYGSVMEVMFQEAIDIPDSSEVIAQLILGDDASFEGWADLQSIINLWV